MIEDFEISLLSEADLVEVAGLERSAFARPWSAEQMRSGLCAGTLSLLGARGPLGLVGYVGLSVVAPEMEILNVAVDPLWRGRGVGRELVRRALELGRELGAKTCFLEVAADNNPALNLYRSQGFSPVGSRRGYYLDQGEGVDAVVMKKEIPPLSHTGG